MEPSNLWQASASELDRDYHIRSIVADQPFPHDGAVLRLLGGYGILAAPCASSEERNGRAPVRAAGDPRRDRQRWRDWGEELTGTELTERRAGTAGLPDVGLSKRSRPWRAQFVAVSRLFWQLGALSAVALLLLLILALQALADQPIDDAYISFRYAQNWASGVGPVFNRGEVVDGYSSFLWVALLALANKAGLTPPLAARLLSLASVVVVLGWLILRTGAGSSLLWAAALAVVLVLSPHTARNVLGGLEGPLAAALLLSGVLLLETRRRRLAPIAFLLLSLTRPEGIALALAVGAVDLWHTRHDRGRLTEAARAWTLGLLVPYALFLGWHVAFYAHLLPNSVYAKSGQPLGAQLGQSARYVTAFLTFYWPVVVLALTGCLLAGSRRESLRPHAATAGLALIGVNLVIGSGDPYTPYARYIYPVMPILVCLAAIGATGLVTSARSLPWRRLVVAACVGLLCAVQAWLCFSSLDTPPGAADLDLRSRLGIGRLRFFAQDSSPHLSGAPPEKLTLHIMANWLSRNASADELLATSEIGTAPYYSGLRVLDMYGLVDRHIGHAPGRPGEKTDARYVFDRKPDYISMKVTTACMCGGTLGDNRILTNSRLRDDYDLVRAFDGGDETLLLFERRLQPAARVVYDFLEEFEPGRLVLRDRDDHVTRPRGSARTLAWKGDVAYMASPADERDLLPQVRALNDPAAPDYAGAEQMRRWLANWRRILFHQPLTDDLAPGIRYAVTVPNGAKLRTGVGLLRDFWDPRLGDGVTYEIRLLDSSGADQILFSAYVDPKNDPADRRWRDVVIGLAPWWGQTVQITFLAWPGPSGSREFNLGGCGEPQLVVDLPGADR